VGQKWNNKVEIKAGSLLTLPGSLVIECQEVTEEGATVRSTFDIKTAGTLASGAGPIKKDSSQHLKKTGANPYSEIVGTLFDSGPSADTTIDTPVSTQEKVTADKEYNAIKQTFTKKLPGATTDTTFTLYMVKDEGMVKQQVDGKGLPAAFTAGMGSMGAMAASLPFNMTTTLTSREMGTPSTPIPAATATADTTATDTP